MSLPPLNPERTASGIIVDPQTLERVIPQSKRKDGTVRKEQKVRPGFTPQEDVGRFRSSRQAAEDARANSRPTIPGSNRLGPQASKSKEENVFASEPREKTKAQIKNEKRREKRREKVAVSWDEDDDDDEDVGKLDEEFKKVDIARHQQNGEQGKTSEKGAEQSFPPLEDNGGVPNESILDDIHERETETKDQSAKTAAIEPAPPAPSGSQPETALEQKTTTKPSIVDDRKNEVQQKPHPIQGGRKGPIGLANPPPIEEPRPSRADTNDWRTAGRKPSRGGRQQSNRGGSQNQGNRQGQNQGNKQNQNQTKPTPAQQQPRERKEYKVREGGANDISSLASRVKNLVVANTVGNASREGTKKDDGKASA
ncbi:hypothetical protein I302_107858 [Kwoniella bestiolae CBS 10118]|uniref:WIBG Mago-binding domain-containing protein n=1 Tax=Kwoniella bestiolae CBS 10118 TaxID=1296100 RepID=A0A1B9FXD1_9TREE|nr:hypothetical protein I302_06402 [Kwoniella bestiolae CBS 10118]OCF23420.1 hypothetical protein I302_06402 [Kwoniella bestiolae CBS 10118]